MYLPSEVIQKMLKACNILDYEKIYVSNEYGVNKISGILFKKVIQDKKINVLYLRYSIVVYSANVLSTK